MATVKPVAVPTAYKLGTIRDTLTECYLDREVLDDIPYSTCVLTEGVATLEDGSSILSLVFAKYGLDRYVDLEREGKCTLSTIDGNPLNCVVDNITVILTD